MAYNVLFYTSFKVSPTKGGTERITISIATGLKNYYGCNCFSLYCVPEMSPKEKCFEEEFQVNYSDLLVRLPQIIDTYKIDVVINQGDFALYARTAKAFRRDHVSYFFAHHFQPGWEENFVTRKTLSDKLHNDNGKELIKSFIKYVGYPVYRLKYINDLTKKYKAAYDFADRTVLLAEGYIDEYAEYAGITDRSKFNIIPNSLSYTQVFDIENYEKKGKKVLIVSRMDETPKKISRALMLWKEIKSKKESEDWELDLVGDGSDLPKYKRLVKDENIPNVKFWGRQTPDRFYEDASIFMMTSKSEGWGLTLTESQQFAVVPVVFDTCIAFHEIIQNDVNGVLVEPWDQEKYVREICSLMSDKIRRRRMAIAGYNACQRFSQKNVARKWEELFETIENSKK